MNAAQNEADQGPERSPTEEKEDSSVGHSSDNPSEDREPLPAVVQAGIGDTHDGNAVLNGTTFAGFQKQETPERDAKSIGSGNLASPLQARAPSLEESFSTPDDTPSIQVSFSCAIGQTKLICRTQLYHR